MLNFGFLDKGLGIISPVHFRIIFQQKCSLCYMLIIDQISLSSCLYFLNYWAICVLQLFINQVVTSQILKLNDLSNQAIFIHDQKNSRKRFKYLENEKSF